MLKDINNCYLHNMLKIRKVDGNNDIIWGCTNEKNS